MADPSGFLKYGRQGPARRPIPLRLRDWNEVYEPFAEQDTRAQAARCMDCGIPFCHQGCPLGNIIPEWNDLVRTGKWEEASDRLHATNNFPEFTGRLCPAPCEAACVLGIGDDPVSIKLVEQEIADHAIAAGFGLTPRPAELSTGRSVAVIGSGPAGSGRRPAAGQGRSRGHRVRAGRPDRRPDAVRHPRVQDGHATVLDRRLAQMEAEGVTFVAGCRRRRRPDRRAAADRLRRRRASPPGPPIPRELDRRRPAPGRRAPGDALPDPAERGPRGHAGRGGDLRRGQEGGHHRRRRHRRRLLRHGAAAERRVGHPAGHPRDAAAHPRPVHAVADLPADAADLGRARGGRRAGLRRQLHLDRGHRRQGQRPAPGRGQADPRRVHPRPRAPRSTSTPT